MSAAGEASDFGGVVINDTAESSLGIGKGTASESDEPTVWLKEPRLRLIVRVLPGKYAAAEAANLARSGVLIIKDAAGRRTQCNRVSSTQY